MAQTASTAALVTTDVRSAVVAIGLARLFVAHGVRLTIRRIDLVDQQSMGETL